MGFQGHPSVQMGHPKRSFLKKHLDLGWTFPCELFHAVGEGLPSMAPRTLAWDWFEPFWWVEGFLEDRTHTNDMASGMETR